MGFRLFQSFRAAWIVILCLVLTGMASVPPILGGTAPPFESETLEGRVLKSSDMEGQYVVLNFWATWCVPCVKEMPELQKAHRALKDQNVKILGVNFAESKSKIEIFLKERNLDFTILLDGFGRLSQDYRVVNLPVTYFISPDGIVREQTIGGNLTLGIIEEKINRMKNQMQQGLDESREKIAEPALEGTENQK